MEDPGLLAPSNQTGLPTILIPCELRAPEDFLKWRYNLLDTSATRVVHPGIQSVVGNTHGTYVEQVVSSFQKSSGARNSHGTIFAWERSHF